MLRVGPWLILSGTLSLALCRLSCLLSWSVPEEAGPRPPPLPVAQNSHECPAPWAGPSAWALASGQCLWGALPLGITTCFPWALAPPHP